MRRFGVFGEQLKAMGDGKLNGPLETVSPDPKSIGHASPYQKTYGSRRSSQAASSA